MKFTFKYQSSGGLRVIDEIPDIPLCQLEGRNGIGKTLAIRLLQLACGQMPYRTTPLAWLSLKNQLRWCDIHCDSADGSSIVFRLSPDRWPEIEADLTDDVLGVVVIDGKPASFLEARKRLDVVRIAGDETLAETIADGVEERAIAVASFAEVLEERVERWETQLVSVAGIAHGLNAEKLVALASEAKSAADSDEEVESRIARLGRRRDHLHRLVQVADQLQILQNRVPQLSEELQRSNSELTRRERDLQKREADLHTLLSNRSQSASLRREVQQLTSLLKRRQNALGKAEVDLSSHLSLLGLTSVPNSKVRRSLIEEATNKLTNAVLRRAQLDTIGPALSLTAKLTQPLSDAVAHGHGEHVVALLDHPVQASELLEGVKARRDDLLEQPRPGELEALDLELARLQDRLSRLETLPALSDRLQRARGRVDEVVESLSRAIGRTGTAAEQQLQQAQGAVATARDRVVEQQVATRTIQRELQELGEMSGEALEAEAKSLERAAGVQADLAVEALSEVVEALAEEEDRLSETRQRAVSAQRQLEAAERAMFALEQQIASSRDYSWAVPAWNVIGETPQPDVLVPEGLRDVLTADQLFLAKRLDRLGSITADLANRAIDARDAAYATQAFLEDLAVDIRSRAPGRRAPAAAREDVRGVHAALHKRVRSFLEQQISDSLLTDALRQELFENSSEVYLDLRQLTLRWVGPTGEVRRRPLEAFSSGEQAYSYTLAKLEALGAHRKSAFVVLVLDEFGAFVARDRLGQLLGAVKQRALGGLADQAVIILPLSRNYLEEPLPAPDDTSLEACRVREVHERGYFALPVEPSEKV